MFAGVRVVSEAAIPIRAGQPGLPIRGHIVDGEWVLWYRQDVPHAQWYGIPG